MSELSYFAGMAKESYNLSKTRRALYAEIDKHRLGQWQPNSSLASLPWIQGHNFSSTQPADALDAGARTFAIMMPKITITPLDESPMAYEDAERQETVLDWHLKRMNMWGGKSTHWRILESAMRYCAVAFETEYLPFKYKSREKDRRVKQMLNGSHFRWTVHHPANVHPLFSQYGMEGYTITRNVTLKDIIFEYGEENEGVKKAIAKLGSKPDAAQLMTTLYTLVKCRDWEETCEWLVPSTGTINGNFDAKDELVLMKEEHKLDFLPLVFTDNEDPILKNAINTGLLDNLNNLRLMSFAAAVAMAASSQYWVQTPDGTLSNVHIDNQNPVQPLVTGQEVRVTPLQQQRPNDAIEQKVVQASQEVSSSTVAQILADANKLAGNENFSTANMAFQIAKGSLALAVDAAERAEEAGLYQMYQWIDHAGDKPLIGYREKDKRVGEVMQPRGATMVISKGEFDTASLYIDVKLKEFSMMDEQAKWNLAITQVERLGFSREVVAEEYGLENYALHEQKRAVEDLTQADIQAEITRKQLAVQNEAQMAMMKAQQAAQPAPSQPGNQVSQMNADFGMAQGMDPRGGMMPPTAVNPGETREQITGMSAGGQGLA